LLAAPPKHAPPDGHDVDEDIKSPQRLNPVGLDCLAVVNCLANASQDVRYAEAHYDRQNYTKIFEYAHSLSLIGGNNLKIDLS
jgi:hypothetical protein